VKWKMEKGNKGIRGNAEKDIKMKKEKELL
jgi:hypothetical protein